MADWPQPALKTKKPGALCWLAALLAGYTVCLLFAVAAIDFEHFLIEFNKEFNKNIWFQY